MLETIKEWHLLCFDTAEFETLLSVQSPVWKDIASRLRFHHKICSSKCHEKFISVSIHTVFPFQFGKGANSFSFIDK